jgi:hypothetical protein
MTHHPHVHMIVPGGGIVVASVGSIRDHGVRSTTEAEAMLDHGRPWAGEPMNTALRRALQL